MARKRWVQIDGKLIPVDGDYVQPDMAGPEYHILGDKNYEGIRSPIDGADLTTRTKHREYMRRNDLAITDDFKSQWSRQAQDRVAGKDSTRKQDVINAVNHHYDRR